MNQPTQQPIPMDRWCETSISWFQPERVEEQAVELVERLAPLYRSATGHNPDRLKHWVDVGVQWIAINADFINLTLMSQQILAAARQACGQSDSTTPGAPGYAA